MMLYRSASVLHLHKLQSPPLLLSQIKLSYSFLSTSSVFLPFRIRLFSLNRSHATPNQSFATAASTAVADNTFFAEDAVSWASLGLSDRVSRSVSSSGHERPSLVQAASIPSILSGKDVVVAAETGSGKTHSYLVPLIDKLLCETEDDCEDSVSGSRLGRHPKISLVLCPNVLLCEQVVRMANTLRDEHGQPLLNVASVCGRQGWPVTRPDIIVSTPAALLNNIEPNKLRLWNFMRIVKYVVFDEVDMLLCGSFQNQVIRLINLLRFDEKQLSREGKDSKGIPAEIGFDSLPNSNLGNEEDLQNEIIDEEDEDSESDCEVECTNEGNEDKSMDKKDWRRIRKSYERSKQYIFVAATLPINGKRTAGGVLKKMFPDAIWVSGTYLHCHNPRLEQRWIEVAVDTQVDALIEAVNQGRRSEASDNGDCVTRTMVFANTVEAVEAVAKILGTAGIDCHRYHKDSSLEERAKTLDDFREKGGIMVCTDAAARGIDIPNISHIIQADFATSAVDFLHRVGRTARAGQHGLVTSLYTESSRDLVDAIIHAKKMGQPVETAFSRKRSFRKKIKKRGFRSFGQTDRLVTA